MQIGQYRVWRVWCKEPTLYHQWRRSRRISAKTGTRLCPYQSDFKDEFLALWKGAESESAIEFLRFGLLTYELTTLCLKLAIILLKHVYSAF